jgi:3-methylcrotonyl-CoA carboxylase alpha subunit
VTASDAAAPPVFPPRACPPRPFRRVLVANRGEIALRVFRTCRALGYETVAVYSDADRDARHVREADLAVALGGTAPRESYLDGAKILAAARASEAEAIHPGYGFLSENDAFARAVEEAGQIFIGPHPETIRLMGSKIAAKELMERVGVPVVPGYHGADQDPERLATEGRRIGFPLLVKAAAGGGGKGMRVVERPDDLAEAIRAARRESESAFGDGALLLERYLTRARHLEVQIFGDHQGHLLHLFERECTVQRRHQKILEEAPAAGLSEETRRALHRHALTAARAVAYVGAGTVEFVLDPEGGLYFLEMNTRLQVEHPVTEAVTGLDLVAWQLAVAEGRPLPCRQDALEARSHAVEVRVYAEDARHEFLPAPGRIEAALWPADTRIETALTPPEDITAYYDPMIAKIVVCAATREACFDRLARALDATALFGTTTNLDLLRALARDPALREGTVHTGYVAEARARLLPDEVTDPWLLAALALSADGDAEEARQDPWRRTDAFALGGTRSRFGRLHYAGGLHTLRLVAEGDGSFRLEVDGRVYPALGVDSTVADRPRVGHDGVERTVTIERRGPWILARHGAGALEARTSTERARRDGGEETGHTRPPFPGRVTAVRVAAGQRVERGDPLVTIEGMKMEYTVRAPFAGTVRTVHAALGQTTDVHRPLVDLDPADKDAS